MAQDHTVRVIVERKKQAGCGTFLGVLILIALAIKYWYVALAIVAAVVVIGLVVNSQQHEKELEKQRNRPGPRDPWLNEVAVALANLGLTEVTRNTGAQLGGVPLEADIGLQDERFLVYVNLFSYAEGARQAEIGLRANPKIRDAIASGRTILKAADRVMYVANGRGGVVDEFRLEEIAQIVGKVSPPLPLVVGTPVAPVLSASTPANSHTPSLGPDALEQIRRLGELRDALVLNQAEFEAKKAELLRRV